MSPFVHIPPRLASGRCHSSLSHAPFRRLRVGIGILLSGILLYSASTVRAAERDSVESGDHAEIGALIFNGITTTSGITLASPDSNGSMSASEQSWKFSE